MALLAAAAAAYLATAVLSSIRRGAARNLPAMSFSLGGIALHIAFIITRTVATGFLPFASRFEALLLFALAVQSAGLVLYLFVPRGTVLSATAGLGAVLVGAVLVKSGFEPGGGLNPILNSPWFAVHILLAFAGYGILTAGLAWDLTALFDRSVAGAIEVPARLARGVVLFLGAGILTGALWADESWGAYWNWDPKESWALLTWAVMMTHAHVAGRTPRRWVSVLLFAGAFATMMFTFVGINLLKWGAHRY
jgi:ABC-type transport system involved in cytochrome c biogenesis permease subunit